MIKILSEANSCDRVLEKLRRLDFTSYARLSDKTREQDYFRVMQIIEQGGIKCDEPYRVSDALQKLFEEKKLLQQHDKELPE